MADQDVQHGVATGCAVTAQASPNMTVAVAAGAVLNGNVPVSVAAQNATITTADATLDRYDLVSVTSAGVVTVTAGTPADVPVQPDSSDVRIAYVYVYSQANALYTGTIVAAAIQDVRRFVLIHTSPYSVSGKWYGVSSLDRTSNTCGSINVSGQAFLTPWFIAKTLAIQNIGIYSAVAAGAASKARLGLYSDDGAGSLTLLGDAGQTAIDTTGERILALALTLAPGWVWRCAAWQSLSGSANVFLDNPGAFSPVGTDTLTHLTQTAYGGLKYTGVTGALPATFAVASADFSSPRYPAIGLQAT